MHRDDIDKINGVTETLKGKTAYFCDKCQEIAGVYDPNQFKVHRWVCNKCVNEFPVKDSILVESIKSMV